MKEIISFIANLIVFTMLAVGFVLMMKEGEKGRKLLHLKKCLRFFTVLSNIFAGLAALVYAIALIPVLAGSAAGVPHWIFIVKYVSAAAVGLTFLTVMAFLGPKNGYGKMFNNANMLFHLLLPLASMLSFMLCDHGSAMSFPETLFAVLPSLIYSAFYMGNILKNGVGEGDDTRDWYGYLTWGWPVGIAIAVVTIAATWGLGVAMRAINMITG